MRRWLVVLLLLTVAQVRSAQAGSAQAPSLVVYPFESQDTLLGVAVADLVAGSLDANAIVVGPDVAPSIIPPFVVQGGFINLLALVGPDAMTGPSGAALLRGAVGADVAVTGSIALADDGYHLDLIVEDAAGATRTMIAAGTDDTVVLARGAASVVAAALGVKAAPIEGPLDLSGAYGEYARALTLVGAGLPQDAAALLRSTARDTSLPPRAEALAEDLGSLFDGGNEAGGPSGARSARMAVLSLSLPTIDEMRSIERFQRMRQETGLPVADVWLGTLRSSVNDKAGATEAFDGAADAYAFGKVARAAFRLEGGSDGTDADLDAVMAGWPGGGTGPAALLGVSVVEGQVPDADGELEALRALGHAAPFLTYPFERGSFLAFDADDPALAAELLAVAHALAPDQSLYATNLGWATYLLGDLRASERYSLEALDLDPSQYIAAYNLGLVRTVTGRLEEALRDYAGAMRNDPGIDDEAIHDLENARQRYPRQSAVWFSLANLYEADGRRLAARDAYQTYLERSGADAPLRAVAEQRVEALSGPAPSLQVYGAIEVLLGRRGTPAAPFHPGDTLYPSFELGTPGDALPRQMDVSLALLDADGASVASAERQVAVPADAVGFVIDDLPLDLPLDLAAGSYSLRVSADASEDRHADAQTVVEVRGAPEPLRRLIGRGIVMRSLAADAPLYRAEDLGSGRQLADILLPELRASGAAADQALPEIVTGRFAGMTGAEVFGGSSAADIDDFVTYLLATDTRDTSFTFVDAYAQWVIDGAPLRPGGLEPGEDQPGEDQPSGEG